MDPALLLVAGLAIILLLQFSRVRRQQRDIKATQASIEVGAEVLTAAGMVGTVLAVGDATVTLQGIDGHTTRWIRGAVVRVLPDSDPASSRYRPPAADPDVTGTAPETGPPDVVDGDGTPRNQD